MNKRILIACELLLLACAAVPTTVRAQTLWVFDKRQYEVSPVDNWTMGMYSSRLNPTTPSAYLMGSLPSSGAVGEVVVAQHVIGVGQEVPLPHYADGTVATEAECFWTVALWAAHFHQEDILAGNPNYDDGDFCSIGFAGRTLAVGSARIASGQVPNFQRTSDVEVLVTVVAVRGGGATKATSESWGGVKLRYK